MAKTKKAKRASRKKVLTKRLKEQNRNAKKVEKRIERIERDIWELELDAFQETGLLQQLTWTYQDRVRLMGCTAIGFRSTETTQNSKVVKKIQKWIWKLTDKRLGEMRFFRKAIDGYIILLALQMDWIDDDANWNENIDPMAVTIFAIDVEETGTGCDAEKKGTSRDAEKKALKTFAEKWDIEVDIQ